MILKYNTLSLKTTLLKENASLGKLLEKISMLQKFMLRRHFLAVFKSNDFQLIKNIP